MDHDRRNPATRPVAALVVLYFFVAMVTKWTGIDLEQVGTILSVMIGIGLSPILTASLMRLFGMPGMARLQLPLLGTIQNAALCWRCLFRLVRGRQHEHTHLTRWD